MSRAEKITSISKLPALKVLAFAYILNPKLLFHSILLLPDRFLTVFAGLLTVILMVIKLDGIEICYLFGNSEGTKCAIEDRLIGSGIILLALLMLAVISAALSIYVTRYSPESFAKLITETKSTAALLKIISAESYLLIARLYAKNNQSIFEEIEKARVGFEIVDHLKLTIADRLAISPRILCERFLRFSPSIVKNRLVNGH